MLEGGIYGSIHSVESDSMLVKIADKCVVKVHQRGVRVILKGENAGSASEVKKVGVSLWITQNLQYVPD